MCNHRPLWQVAAGNGYVMAGGNTAPVPVAAAAADAGSNIASADFLNKKKKSKKKEEAGEKGSAEDAVREAEPAEKKRHTPPSDPQAGAERCFGRTFAWARVLGV